MLGAILSLASTGLESDATLVQLSIFPPMKIPYFVTRFSSRPNDDLTSHTQLEAASFLPRVQTRLFAGGCNPCISLRVRSRIFLFPDCAGTAD
jgi:hypothetical protein